MEKFEIYFKVNQNKILNENNKLFNQLEKVYNYIIKRKKLNVDTLYFKIGTIDNDFVKNKITIEIIFNLKK